MNDVRPPFRQAVHLALQDHISRQHLERALSTLEGRVRHALTGEDAQELRARVQQVRTQTIHQLPDLYEQLQVTASQNGIQVCEVDTPAEAIACFLDILSHRDPVATINQGILEEVNAYDALQEEGYRLLDLHLGDYFLHLIEDEKAHPVVPLAHLSLMDMGTAWTETTGHAIRPTADAIIAALSGRVRANIRRARSALIPAAFAIAETGTIVLLDNEGTLAPVIHRVDTLVIVMGIHRVVPTLADLPPLVEAMARGSHGTTTFATTILIHTPSQNVHLVLVDNERERLYREGYEAPLRCLECAACATVCPAFREVGGQVYGTPYMGPIGHILPPLLWPDRYAELAFGTPMCGIANAVCPVGLDFPALIARARAYVRQREGVPWRIRAFLNTWRHGVHHPLGRILTRLGTEALLSPPRVEGVPPSSPPPPPSTPALPSSASPLKRLASLWAPRGWGIEVEDNPVAARLTLISYLQEHHIRHVVGWAPEAVGMEGLPEALADVGIQWHNAVDNPTVEEPFVGLVKAEAVTTENGTVIIRSAADMPLAPMFHAETLIVMVERERMVPTWEDALSVLPTQATFVLLADRPHTFALDGMPHPTPFGPQRLHLVIIQSDAAG